MVMFGRKKNKFSPDDCQNVQPTLNLTLAELPPFDMHFEIES